MCVCVGGDHMRRPQTFDFKPQGPERIEDF